MSGRAFSKNNVIAGSFVLVSVTLAVVASIVISGAAEMFQSRTDYVVRFTLDTGAPGLKAGSQVNAGGQPVGRVRAVRVALEAGRPVGVDAVVSVRSDLVLYEDATAFLEAPILGGISTINIPMPGAGNVAQPHGSGPRLEAHESIPGRLAPPTLLAQAGYGEEQARKVAEIIDHVHAITERAQRDLNPMLDSVQASLADFRSVAADVRQRTPQWAGNVDTVLEKAAHAATELDSAVADARSRLEEVRRILASGQDAIDRNRPAIDGTIDSIRSATRKIDEESMPLLNETLASGRDGAKQFQSLAARAEAFLSEESPSLRRMIGNFRLAADQIKLAAIEIRTKPWLLLYTPKAKELESDTLYSAARSYAEAVSDLRAASASLEVAATNQGTPLADQESLESMRARLKETFATYEKAERALLDRLIKAREGG